MRHIIPISGKDSLATAIVQRAREPDLPYEFLFNDTRMELPATYEWLEQVEAKEGITIVRAGKSLRDIIYEQKILPSAQRRYCTKLAKIHPMRDYVGEDEATIYIGIRADEDRVGAQETKNLAVKYPLRELGVNLPLVYRIVDGKGLMPPAFHWESVYWRVRKAMWPDVGVIDELPRWVRERLFAWRSRPNCFMCFYQRRYEWAGLLEHYPELFAEAEEIEAEVGFSENTKKHAFLWIGPGVGLAYIREHFHRLVQARVDAIVKVLREKQQMKLALGDEMFDGIDAAQTSCGLYCGK